ncbi:glycoside hydrolase superfamily [Haematococcus lacustris]
MELERGGQVVLVPPTSPPTASPAGMDEFVQRSGNQFKLKGKPFYFTGMNAYWWIDAASWGRSTGRRQVVQAMAAAKRLGMRVVRTWGFNSRMPAAPGVYDEEQFQALDFIIYASGAHGLKLQLALGNFWNAYKAPEEFVWWGMGTNGKGILDFYGNANVKTLFKNHITAMLTRVNTFTGVAYKDDPAIMSWDVLNEPRCPACDTKELQDLAVGWMREMTDFTKQTAPKQLVALGTEGFFTKDDVTKLHLTNPGPGAECEGEDWIRIVALPSVDFATLHVYDRHMERQPVPPEGRTYIGDPDWMYCDDVCYLQWFPRYMQAHTESLAATSNKPLVVQEYGMTWWQRDARNRKVLLAVMGRLLANSKASGGGLAGALLWNGADNNTADQDGYNVRIDRWPSALIEAPPALKSLPNVMSYLRTFVNPGASPGQLGNASPTPSAAETPGVVASGRRSRKLQAANHAQPSLQPSVRDTSDVLPDSDSGDGAARQVHVRPHEAVMASISQRALLYQADKLDGFRRGWERGSCAHESSRVWRPPVAWANSSRGSQPKPGSVTAEMKQWEALDIQAFQNEAWPAEEVDILKWTSDQVN